MPAACSCRLWGLGCQVQRNCPLLGAQHPGLSGIPPTLAESSPTPASWSPPVCIRRSHTRAGLGAGELSAWTPLVAE